MSLVAKRKNIHAVALGRKGGKARLTEMTDEERKEVAKKAAAARWAGHEAKRPASTRKKPAK
jgi:hypothetical protein